MSKISERILDIHRRPSNRTSGKRHFSSHKNGRTTELYKTLRRQIDKVCIVEICLAKNPNARNNEATVERMLSSRFSMDDIQAITGLSMNTIQTLQVKLTNAVSRPEKTDIDP